MSDATGPVTGLAPLNDLLDGYLVPAGSRATILEAVTAVQTEDITVAGRPGSSAGWVSLAPVGGPAAASVHRDRLSVTLDRRSALRTTQEYEFCRIEESAGTGDRVQLIMDQWAVQQHAVVVRRLILTAIRAAAPKLDRRSGARLVRPASRSGVDQGAGPKPAVCPVHFVQLVNGSCDFCD